MRTIFLLVLTITGNAFALPQVLTFHSGTVTGIEVWGPNTHHLINSLAIENRGIVFVLPGTSITLRPSSTMEVYGEIRMMGDINRIQITGTAQYSTIRVGRSGKLHLESVDLEANVETNGGSAYLGDCTVKGRWASEYTSITTERTLWKTSLSALHSTTTMTMCTVHDNITMTGGYMLPAHSCFLAPIQWQGIFVLSEWCNYWGQVSISDHSMVLGVPNWVSSRPTVDPTSSLGWPNWPSTPMSCP